MSKNQKGTTSANEQKEEEENSKKLLNRKTKRETNNQVENINIPLTILKNYIRCSICLEYELFSSKCYNCKICSSHFHLDCYNLFNFSEEKTEKITNNNLEDFICERCSEEKKGISNISCYICGEHDGIIKKLKENQYIHHYCYVFFKDRLHQVKNGKCNNCKIKNIPVLKCENHGCKEKYHMKCALVKGLIFSLPYLRDEKNEEKEIKESFNEKIPFFCEVHNKDYIENYAQYITAMKQSMNDKKIKSDNNPINEIQNENNDNNKDEIISSNKEKENNSNSEKIIINNEQKIGINDENANKNEKEQNKSISSNSDIEDNYGSNNSEEPSDKTPVNNYSIEKVNSVNEKNSVMSNNIVSNENNTNNNNNNDNTNNNNEIINSNDFKNNEQENKQIGKENNKNEINNENINNDNDDEDIDINMICEEDDKNKNEKMDEENNENDGFVKDEEDIIITGHEKENLNENKENKEKEKEKFKIPEVKYEYIDLFSNFNKMNEDYYFPGNFYKFHGM